VQMRPRLSIYRQSIAPSVVLAVVGCDATSARLTHYPHSHPMSTRAQAMPAVVSMWPDSGMFSTHGASIVLATPPVAWLQTSWTRNGLTPGARV